MKCLLFEYNLCLDLQEVRLPLRLDGYIYMIYNMIRYAVCVLKFMFTEEKGQTHKEINVMRLNKSQ